MVVKDLHTQGRLYQSWIHLLQHAADLMREQGLHRLPCY